MQKPHITLPNRPKPYLSEAYNGYYGTLKDFRPIIVRFWKTTSSLYENASLLCSIFPIHTSPSLDNGFMNEFQIHSLVECYTYYNVWFDLEFCIRNWKYCEYFIGSEPVYHNEMDCYIRNILKDVEFPNVKTVDCKEELKFLHGRWANEKHLFDIIRSLFPDCTVLFHFRAKWLENLELDIFIKELSVGIEYQGIQHYSVIEHWGGKAGLKQRQYNDERKKILCKANNIKLIYFDYTETITHTYIKNKLVKSLKGIPAYQNTLLFQNSKDA